MVYTIGVDIGGTKVAAVIIDQHSKIRFRAEVPSNPEDKEKMFKQVVTCIDMVIDESGILFTDIGGMGVGVPGKVDRKNGIAIFQNNLPWQNFPVVERLKAYYKLENIAVDNDVYMAAFAEWKVSGMKEQDTFVYVTVSTGISCSIIHQGSFLRGAGFAGELGLFPVVAKSSPNGINNLENAASGTAIQKMAQRHFENPNMTTKDVLHEFQQDNKDAQMIINEVVESLAHGIYSIVCLLDPNKIILGGGVINNHPYLLDLVKDALLELLIPEQQSVLERMHTSHFKGDSGVVGAGFKGRGDETLIRNEVYFDKKALL